MVFAGKINNKLVKNYYLIKTLIKKDIIGKYRGSFFGLLLPILNSLFMLAIYTFVFSFVFNAKYSMENNSNINFSLTLLIGLLVFNIFSEALHRSPSLILSNRNYVKKIIFPLNTLPLIILITALFHFILTFILWCFLYIFFVGPIEISSAIFLIPIIFSYSIFILGIIFLISAVGVYFRDIEHFISPISTLMLFCTPIFYPISILPESIRKYIFLNPISYPVLEIRELLIYGNSFNYLNFILFTSFSIIFFLFGFYIFKLLRKGFADVI